ncbi:MAG: signal peptide peptidase SppA [Candidatus Anammoximicrobium sp.]|nr:signal peptide peptidase SppA [Candidatus Anammoximicrobium sp.]
MSQITAAAGPANSPVPPSSPIPPQINIHTGSSLLQRVLCWLGWTGCLIFLVLFAGLSYGLREYFDTTEGIRERYHSGTKYARDKVAIITVDGLILEGNGFVKRQIDRVRDDEHVKAVVVRVNSPGGTITGSDYIHHHLAKLRQEKKVPLVVSMGGVAASGGYYLAMAVGDQPKSIYAEPTTTTGSIGVIVPHYDVSGLLANFNVKDDSIVSHPRKQLLAMTRPVSDEDRKILQAYVNEAFGRFKDIVQGGRPVFRKAPQKLDELATGEIFTAQQAKNHGLIDEIGFIEDAVERALELAKLDKDQTRVVEYKPPPSLLEVPWLGEASAERSTLALLLELNTPRAYYLATTLPPLIDHRPAAARP